jgi:Tfp pilus assembly protein PilO
MIGNSFIVQMSMLVLAVGIVFFYVHPTFTNIGEIQESILEHQAEIKEVNAVNARLVSLVNRLNSISSEENRALITYLPDTVDQVSVSRDINQMATLGGAVLSSIRFNEQTRRRSADTSSDPNQPTSHSFTASITGTYEQIKSFLSLVEQNNYPLEVTELKISASDTGILNADVGLTTYSQTKPI